MYVIRSNILFSIASELKSLSGFKVWNSELEETFESMWGFMLQMRKWRFREFNWLDQSLQMSMLKEKKTPNPAFSFAV